VKGVSDSAAFLMDDVILGPHRRPNEAFAREVRIHDDISRLPVLPWFCELAVPAVTKREDCGWQIGRGMNLLEARGI
jgi:hypothetical protein